MKKCVKCGVTKTLEDFPRRKDSPDGYRNECSACKKVRDALVHKNRMAKPGAREAEALRLKTLQASLPADEIARRNDLANSRNRAKAEQEKAEYLARNGCTKREMKLKEDKAKFINDSISRNGDRYDYSDVDYQGVWPPVKIRCNKHNLTFMQTPKSHSVGSGCPKCAKESTGNALRKSQEDFIDDAKALCGDKYTYEHVEYVKNHVPVLVTCPTHGEFPIRPGNLLTGKGCPACAKYGYRDSLPGTLYVLSNGELTKIGITNNTAISRLKQLNKKGKNFDLCAEFSFANGKEASTLEGALLNLFRETHLQPAEKFDGSTECFYELEPEYVTSVIDSILNNKEHNDYRSNLKHWETPTASC